MPSAASSPIFSPATGASKADAVEIRHLSFRHAKKLAKSRRKISRVLPHDQTAHYRNHAHGPGLLRQSAFSAKNEKIHSIRPVPSSAKRLDVLSSSAR